MQPAPEHQGPTLFGHPAGLFTLFFAEMWERFSYYGMRALLILYMLKGFLSYGDEHAYAVYGAYTALVYMTPFFGGMLADRLLGARRAVMAGAVFMAAGQALLMVPHSFSFFTGLALLICGNGFFKPNISTIVGALYPPGSRRRDGGFTIFYMGINLGAAMSPLLCGYVGEKYGWSYGFGLATLGMLFGLAVFANWLPPGKAGAPPDPERLRHRPAVVSQGLILLGAIGAAGALVAFRPEDNLPATAVNVFVACALLAAAGIGCLAQRGGRGGLITLEWSVYLGTSVAVPVFVLLVSGFAPLMPDHRPVVLIPEQWLKHFQAPRLVQERLEELAQAAKHRSPARVERLAADIDRLYEGQNLTAAQYAAFRDVLGLAQAQRWEDAATKLAEVASQFPPERLKSVLAVLLSELSRPATLILMLSGLVALGYLVVEMVKLDRIARERMYVVLVLTLFSMLFWAFFEQAGSSVNNFTDRNVDRVREARRARPSEVGTALVFRIPAKAGESLDAKLDDLPLLTQEQLGQRNGHPGMKRQIEQAIRIVEQSRGTLKPPEIDRLVRAVNEYDVLTMTSLTYLRTAAALQPHQPELQTLTWQLVPENVGMGIGGSETPASVFQAANPIYILLFGLVFSALWGFLAARGLEPSTTVKFALGLLQLGLGFVVFWYAARMADTRGMTSMAWLLLGYLLHTTGELCLSPVGLSMVTRLSPRRLVSTVMGVWFLATAFSQLLAAIIAQFTGVTHGDGTTAIIPPPAETCHVYGEVFGHVAVGAIGAAAVCLALVPLLNRWMHPEVEEQG